MDNEERTYPGARGRRRRVTRAAVAAALLLTAVSASARGAGGDLDPTFGDGGKVVTEVGTVEDRAHAVVTQPDGKIVLAGHSYGGPTADFALVRYNADGSLDGAFGVGGEVVTDLDDSHDGARALVRQPDGKLVAAGSASKGNDHSALALTRYNDDGTLDDTFGVGGKVTTTFAPYVVNGNDLVLQPDGKLVVAGDIGPGPDVALARYNTDGSLDATFGNSGVVASDVYSDTSRTHAVAIQPDGKIVVGGYVTRLPNNDFVLARYKPDGSLDTSFGDAGSLTTDVSGHDLLNDLAVQSDGRIIAVGTSGAGSPSSATTWTGPSTAHTASAAGRRPTSVPVPTRHRLLPCSPTAKPSWPAVLSKTASTASASPDTPSTERLTQRSARAER
jgi:uncharacterized delta-60 repeat protein